MAEATVSEPSKSQPVAGPRRTVTILIVGALVLALAVLAARTFAPGLFADNSVAVEYTTESGKGINEGTVNSPLLVTLRLPWSGGTGDSILASVSLILLDEFGRPAEYGGSPAPGLPLRPTLDIKTWEYAGSLPSKPGTYHLRIQWRRLSGDTSVQALDLEEPVLIARAESGSPLTSGYIFNADGELWILSTDGKRERRFTFLSTVLDRVEYPAWSPDGSRVAFAYLKDIASNELPKTSIWTLNADGTGLTQVVEHGPDESLHYPQWSPDGRYIYFTVENLLRDENGVPLPRRVDRVELATGVRSQWLARSYMAVPTGSGEEVIYLEEIGDSQGLAPLLQVSTAASDQGPHKVVVPPNDFFDLYAPRMSPDRKWVVFAAAVQNPVNTPTARRDFDPWSWLSFEPRTASAHNFPWELYIVPASGGPATRLTSLSDDQPHAVWLDNSTIAFMGIKGLYTLTITPDGKPAGEPARLINGVQHSTLTWHAP